VQILVYVGGVMVLFLFVIMLVNVSKEEKGQEEIFNRPRQVVASLVFSFLLVIGLLAAVNNGAAELQKKINPEATPAELQMTEQKSQKGGTGTTTLSQSTEQVGASLYRYASLPFEIASVLLLVAIIGSVMLARTLKQEASVDDVAPEVLQEEIAQDPDLAGLIQE